MELGRLMVLAFNWVQQKDITAQDCPSDARIITGNPKVDAQYYYFEQESGVTLNYFNDGKYNLINSYEVVDEAKFIGFVLRWS